MEILSFPIILLLIWLAWLFFPFQGRNSNAQIENTVQEIEEEAPLSASPVMYQLNTNLIRYKLYTTKHLRKETQILYSKVILENLWINEPLHSTFFKLLLILDENQFFIRDPFSKVIKCNLRNEFNQMVTVESYTVLSTLEVVEYCISEGLHSILRRKKQNVQNVILAWILWIMSKSQNMDKADLDYLKKIVFEDHTQVDHLVSLIEAYDSRFDFIRLTYDLAINFSDRHPYVEANKKSESLTTIKNLPIKTLQTLPKSVL